MWFQSAIDESTANGWRPTPRARQFHVDAKVHAPAEGLPNSPRRSAKSHRRQQTTASTSGECFRLSFRGKVQLSRRVQCFLLGRPGPFDWQWYWLRLAFVEGCCRVSYVPTLTESGRLVVVKQ